MTSTLPLPDPLRRAGGPIRGLAGRVAGVVGAGSFSMGVSLRPAWRRDYL
jgi:hypothetical protein